MRRGTQRCRGANITLASARPGVCSGTQASLRLGLGRALAASGRSTGSHSCQAGSAAWRQSRQTGMLTTIGSQRTRPHDRRDGFAKEILNQRAGECCGVDAAHRPYTLRGGPWTQHSLAVGRGHRRNGITACAARKSLSARNIARTRRARARAGSCTAHQSAGIEMHSTYASADRTRGSALAHDDEWACTLAR